MTAPIKGRWLSPPSIFPGWIDALVEENKELKRALKAAEQERDELAARLEHTEKK